MLIQKNTTGINDIVDLKLVTGEEVIAKIIDMDVNTIGIGKPIALVTGQAQNGQTAVAMAPFMPGADDTRIELDRNNVVAIAPANEQVRAMYVKATTGLEVPSGANMPKLRG